MKIWTAFFISTLSLICLGQDFEDVDFDGLDDRYDWQINNILKNGATLQKAKLQLEIFQATSVVVIDQENLLTVLDLSKILREFKYGYFSRLKKLDPQQKALQFLVKKWRNQNGKKFNADVLAQYVLGKKSIYLYNELNALILEHELFHVLQNLQPQLYNSFLLKSGWSVQRNGFIDYFFYTLLSENEPLKIGTFTDFDFRFQPQHVVQQLNDSRFPSDYSKLGPSEMFAEGSVATINYSDNANLSEVLQQYPYLERFAKTPLFQFLKQGLYQF